MQTVINSKIKKKDDSPELKRGQVKQILISEFERELPEFDFLEYKNGCYTFENVRIIKGRNVYEHLHVIFALKDWKSRCSVASRINKNYLRSNSYNTGLEIPPQLINLNRGVTLRGLRG